MNKTQIFAAIREKYSSSDLDEHVSELKAQEASFINNSGMDSQVEYLTNQGGLDWLRELLLGEH